MRDRLRCPYCGQPVWSSDEGAACTDPDYATGDTPDTLSCGATWDPVGVLDTPPREDQWTMRKFELRTADDEDRGTVTGNRATAVAAANALTARTGEKVYAQPEGTTVDTAPGTRSR